jgi:DNA-binding FadR family transcriptional regulator
MNGPDQKTVLFTANTTNSRSRKTGTDRDIAQEIWDYVVNEGERVGSSYVAKRFSVGKELVLDVYQELVSDGYLARTNSNRYYRTNKCAFPKEIKA